MLGNTTNYKDFARTAAVKLALCTPGGAKTQRAMGSDHVNGAMITLTQDQWAVGDDHVNPQVIKLTPPRVFVFFVFFYFT